MLMDRLVRMTVCSRRLTWSRVRRLVSIIMKMAT